VVVVNILFVVDGFLVLLEILKESKETKSPNRSLFFPFDEVLLVVVVVDELKVLLVFIGCIGVELNKLLVCIGWIGTELNKLLLLVVVVVLVLVLLIVDEAGGGLDMNNENKSLLFWLEFELLVVGVVGFGASWKD